MKTAADILTCSIENMATVSPETTVSETLRLMVERKIGAIFIKKDGKIVGVWTERDLLRNTISPGFDSRTSSVGQFMVTKLVSAPHTTGLYALMDIIVGRRIRHLLIEKDGEYIGMVSSGDVVRAMLNEKTEELKKLNQMVSWEYYEDWRWQEKDRR